LRKEKESAKFWKLWKVGQGNRGTCSHSRAKVTVKNRGSNYNQTMEVVKKERKENLRKKLVFQVSGAHKGQNREEKSVYQNSVAEPIELCMIL